MAETETQDRTKQQTAGAAPPGDGKSKGQLSVQFRIPYKRELYDSYGIRPGDWMTLTEAVWPSAKTYEGILLAVNWCRSKGYTQVHQIMAKPCHVVPIWNTALRKEVEGVWPSISETRMTAHRTGTYAGCDETKFGPMKTQTFKGQVKDGPNGFKTKEITVTFPEWAQITVYRMVQGHRVAFVGPKLTYLGNYGAIGKTDLPNEKWEQTPEYMLEKCAEAAALRKAFPECDMGPTAEEMEGKKVNAGGIVMDHEEAKAAAAAAEAASKPAPERPTREATEQMRKEQVDQDRQFRQQSAGDRAQAQAHGANEDTGELAGDQGDKVIEGESQDVTDQEGGDDTIAGEKPPAPKEEPKTADAPPAESPHRKFADEFIGRVKKASSLKTLNEFVARWAERLNQISGENDPVYDEIKSAIEARKAAFAK